MMGTLVVCLNLLVVTKREQKYFIDINIYHADIFVIKQYKNLRDIYDIIGIVIIYLS